MKSRVGPSWYGWARCGEGVSERKRSLTEAGEHQALSDELYQTHYKHAAKAMIRNGSVLCQDMGLSSFSHTRLHPGLWNVTWKQQHCVPSVPDSWGWKQNPDAPVLLWEPLQSTKGSIKYLMSVTPQGMWAHCTGGTQWWTQMSKYVGLCNHL